MFKIGTFSKLVQVSVRTLRFYEERGLIRPAHVDDANGYRYYTLDQLPRLNRVLALRNLGLSRGDIARLVNKPLSPERLRVLLCEKQRELAARVEEEKDRLWRVEPQLVASVHDTIPDWEQVNATFNRLFDEVQSHVARHSGKCAGAPLDLWHGPAMSGQDMAVEAAFPIAQPIPTSDRVRVYPLPGVETMASTTHHGPFATLPDAYHALLGWIEANGYRVAGPNREVYLQYDRDGDPNQYVTEIQFPVANV